MQNHERIGPVLISEADIHARLGELAAEIARDFANRDVLHCVAVLKGAFVFMADLGRAIHRAAGPAVRFGFVRAGAYGVGIKHEGETDRPVDLQLMPDDVAGQDVLLVEDIIDQGFTLARIRAALLNDAGARSVRICVLLDKKLDAPTPEVTALRRELVPDYVGFTIPDQWVAGYGLDAAEALRNLPFVTALRHP